MRRLQKWLAHRRYTQATKRVMKHLILNGAYEENRELFLWYYRGFELLIEISNREFADYCCQIRPTGRNHLEK